MSEIKLKIYFKPAYMPVATKEYRQDELVKYQRLVDEQTFKYGWLRRDDLGNPYSYLGVAEAVAVYPEEAMIYVLDKECVNVASIPSGGNPSFNLEMNDGELAEPTDLVNIYTMAGGESFKNFPYVYVLYLAPRRKYIHKVRVVPEGVKIPIPSYMAEFNVIRARDGFITLPVPVADKTAFNSSLEEIGIVNDLTEALNARIIVYHDLKDAVRNLMCFANRDLTAGKDTWVAEWSNLVQDKITRACEARKAEDDRKKKYDEFVKTLPENPLYASLRFKFPWEKIARWGLMVLGAMAGFGLGHILLGTFGG
jgi:hypothetical protein